MDCIVVLLLVSTGYLQYLLIVKEGIEVFKGNATSLYKDNQFKKTHNDAVINVMF